MNENVTLHDCMCGKGRGDLEDVSIQPVGRFALKVSALGLLGMALGLVMCISNGEKEARRKSRDRRRKGHGRR